MNDDRQKRRSHSRSHSRSPYLLPELGRPGKRKESPTSDTSSEQKRSRRGPPLASPEGKGLTSISEGNIPRSLKPSSNTSSPVQPAAEALLRGRGASASPLESREQRRHKHSRRDPEDERRFERDRRGESPSRKRRRDKAADSIAAREAGEIPEGRYKSRDGHSQHHSRDRHGSHSRSRARQPGGEAAQPRVDEAAGVRDMRGVHPSIAVELRQAALALKTKREAEAAVLLAREAEARAVELGPEKAGDEANLVRSRKPSPIVWSASKGRVQDLPDKKIPSSAAERAAQELAAFKGMQTLDIDPDVPVAFKASPSGSDSETGEIEKSAQMGSADAGAEADTNVVMKSRWLMDDDDDDEDLPTANGQANGEDAEVAARNAEEQELALNLEMGQDNEWEDDFSKSDFERTRPPVNMLNKSRNVSDSFEKLNRISEGTYGVVYRARDKETGTICALKQIKMEHEKDGFPLTSIREINILLCFHHKNIVDVSEVVVGSRLDDVYMVMEFMEHDLKKLMETMPVPFTIAETKNLMKQLLEGMEYLHSNWVLHRDLKTSNILYNNQGQLKICDFGLARQYGSPLRSYTNNVVTLYYRAIELLLGTKEYSTAIDIWSLGCIMAELLTKRVLFQGTGEIDQIDKVFKVLGSPTEENWPGHKELEGVKKLKLRRQERTIREILPAASTFDPNAGLTEAGFDLIEGMLALDPKKRITAQEALRHRWFQEQPKVRDGHLMPTYPTGRAGPSRSILSK